MSNPTYYETMYILRPDIPEDEVENHLKKYSEVLEKAKAVIIDNQMRGKRRLAYSIGKYKEGIYVQLSHTGEGDHIEALERTMRLSEDVIRYLTVKQEGPLPTPRSSNKGTEQTEKSDIDNTDPKNNKKPKDQSIEKETKTNPEAAASEKETSEIKETSET